MTAGFVVAVLDELLGALVHLAGGLVGDEVLRGVDQVREPPVFGVHLEQLVPHLDGLRIVLVLERVGRVLADGLHGPLLHERQVPGGGLVLGIDGKDLVQERRCLLELSLPHERDGILLELLDPLELARRHAPAAAVARQSRNSMTESKGTFSPFGSSDHGDLDTAVLRPFGLRFVRIGRPELAESVRDQAFRRDAFVDEEVDDAEGPGRGQLPVRIVLLGVDRHVVGMAFGNDGVAHRLQLLVQIVQEEENVLLQLGAAAVEEREALHLDLDGVGRHDELDLVRHLVLFDEIPDVLRQGDLLLHLLYPRIVGIGRREIRERVLIFHRLGVRKRRRT